MSNIDVELIHLRGIHKDIVLHVKYHQSTKSGRLHPANSDNWQVKDHEMGWKEATRMQSYFSQYFLPEGIP